jgi:UDP-N-acetyl-D-mannosaminuronate dehydrogenase
VFPTVARLSELGASPLVHDPMYSDEELRALGFEPYRAGDVADAAILQADHAEYRSWTPADLPVSAIVDGRRMLAADRFPDAVVVALGSGSTAR